MEASVAVPKVLRVLHGERARVHDLVLTYVAAAITVVIVVLRPSTRPAAVAWWEIAIVAAIAADLVAGVIANFTEGTDRYYAARPGSRVAFLAFHVAHPAVLLFVIGGPVEVWVVIPAYALIAAAIVNALEPRDQPAVAAALMALGIIICFAWYVIAPPALWFGPLFLVKLVLGFAVRRTDLSRGAERES